MISCLIFIFAADVMTHQRANNTFQLQYILCLTVAPHLVLKPTSYPLNRATSDSAPKRGQVCQQLIHHAQYQLISKHKQSIFDIRESWTRGAWQRKCTYSHYSPPPVCCPLSPPHQTGMIQPGRSLPAIILLPKHNIGRAQGPMTVWGSL